MRYVSTRSEGTAAGKRLTFSEAVAHGLAPDGGLYVPEHFPQADRARLKPGMSLAAIARIVLRPFFEGDALEDQLDAICERAFDLPCPITPLEGSWDATVLELHHGPTAAFKDFGARFLAECLCRLGKPGMPPFTVLVATSGDTGGAVGAAFENRPEARVVILFPEGRVSPLQQHQLTCWGDNVVSLSVQPDFDACQALAKAAFSDPTLRDRYHLTSANSINIARLLAQTVYYVALALHVEAETGCGAQVIVPTGNMGNALAAFWARWMGLPIDRVVLATNANRTLADYVATGQYEPRPSVTTIANAMDVGSPSNAERLIAALAPAGGGRGADRDRLEGDWIDDAAIRTRIATDFEQYGRIWCPHTAIAAEIYAKLRAQGRAGPWTIVSTADPAKFGEIVTPEINKDIPIPESLATLSTRPSRFGVIPNDLAALDAALHQQFQ